MMKRTVAFLACAAASGIVLLACTIETKDGSDTPARDAGSSPSDASDASTTSDAGDGGPAKVADPEECKTSANVDVCETCCGMTDEVFQALDVPFIDCICTDKCMTECASTFCSETRDTPNEACNECIARERTGCNELGAASCDKNANCKAFLACADVACADLPEGDAGP